ncbi:hypothetical protein LCGC14_3016690, partial [marine sediment metagenome]
MALCGHLFELRPSEPFPFGPLSPDHRGLLVKPCTHPAATAAPGVYLIIIGMPLQAVGLYSVQGCDSNTSQGIHTAGHRLHVSPQALLRQRWSGSRQLDGPTTIHTRRSIGARSEGLCQPQPFTSTFP